MRSFKRIKEKIGCLLMVFALSTILVFPTAAATPTESSQEITYTCPVYAEPDFDSEIIGQLADTMKVTVLKPEGAFYSIDCYGMTGYVARGWLRFTFDDDWFVHCPPKDGEEESSVTAGSVELLDSIMRLAEEQLGDPYVYGGNGPDGFDCSGFVSYVFREHDIILHRCADEQMQDGLIVDNEDLQIGDLVFFRAYGPWLASHVGIYIGNNRMIHAGSGGICIDSLDGEYWARSYVGARRVLDVQSFSLKENIDVQWKNFSNSQII